MVERLKVWRKERASADGVPAYVVLHDRTLGAIAKDRPSSSAQLRTIEGIGPRKLDRYGAEILALVAASHP